MAGFAERMGYRAGRTVVQSDSLDSETRTELWNLLVILRENMNRHDRVDAQQPKVLDAVWERQFKRARDERPSDHAVWGLVKRSALEAEWVDTLDLIESIVGYLQAFPSGYSPERAKTLADAFNDRCEFFLVGYRFIGLQLTPVESTAEAEAVVNAVADTDEIAGAA